MRLRKTAMIFLLIFGGLLGVAFTSAGRAQAAAMARAMWDANTKTLTFYYGEQKSGGTTHYSGTQITASGSSSPAWHTSAVYNNVTKVVFESTFASVRPTSCYEWFDSMTKLTTITGINYLNTTNVTSMRYMFYACHALTSLNLSSFNTANVTNMSSMFSSCHALTSLNLSSFNTAKVTDMQYMFYNCSALTSLDLSSFNTAKVTDIDWMFRYCTQLQTIYVSESKWSTTAVTNGTTMFYNCTKLVGGYGTTYNSSIIDKTRALVDKAGQEGYLTDKTLSAPHATWDASTNTLTFYYGTQKTTGTKHWHGTQITATGSSTPAWNISSINENLTKVVFESSFASVRPTSCAYWFNGTKKLTTITGITNLKTDDVTNMVSMFYGCHALTSLNLSSFNTAKVTNMASMFAYCDALTSLNISSFNTAYVTKMYNMFCSCSALTSLDLTSFNTAKVTNMERMFYGCSLLQTIYVTESKWSIAAVTNSTYMFNSCSKLVGGNGTIYDSSYRDKTRAVVDKQGQAGYLTDKCTIVWKNEDGTILETDYNVTRGTTPVYNGTTPTKAATAQYSYTFKGWSPTIAAVTKYQVYTATYNSTVRKYTLTVKTATNNTTQGTVKIYSGTAGASATASINYGSTATITATPATGYHFVKWNDNNTNASRSVTVTQDATYTAEFSIKTYTLTVNTENTTMGTVTGGGTYNHGATATLTATPDNDCYIFTQWNDGNTQNPRQVTVTGDATYTAEFYKLRYNISVQSADTDKGDVTIEVND